MNWDFHSRRCWKSVNWEDPRGNHWGLSWICCCLSRVLQGWTCKRKTARTRRRSFPGDKLIVGTRAVWAPRGVCRKWSGSRGWRKQRFRWTCRIQHQSKYSDLWRWSSRRAPVIWRRIACAWLWRRRKMKERGGWVRVVRGKRIDISGSKPFRVVVRLMVDEECLHTYHLTVVRTAVCGSRQGCNFSKLYIYSNFSPWIIYIFTLFF